jgi:hypothetical protein
MKVMEEVYCSPEDGAIIWMVGRLLFSVKESSFVDHWLE